MKFLIIAGHGDGDPGAGGCGYWEANLTREALPALASQLRRYDDAEVITYPTTRNAYADIKNGRPAYSFDDFGAIIELHFNAYNGEAHGTETLYRTSEGLSKVVDKALAKAGEFTDRGPKLRTDLQNMNVAYSYGVPYILIETCFIDNAGDMRKYNLHAAEIWKAVGAAIADYYDLKEVESRIVLQGANWPRELIQGERFVIRGKVKSAARLKSVTVVVEKKNGTDIKDATKKRYTSARRYDLSNIDPYISFRKLKPGEYRYKVKAEDANGTQALLLSKMFKVKRG